MNIKFPSLLPSHLSTCLSKKDYLALCQTFSFFSRGIQHKYQLSFMSTAGRVGDILHLKTSSVSGCGYKTITLRLQQGN